MDEDLTGRSLAGGRYRIVRALGAGGMGAVYVAVQQQLDREVAIKVLRNNLVADPQSSERFKREAHALAQLKHPVIVDVIDFDVDVDAAGVGRAFIAMELVDGTSLRKRLERGRMAWRETLPLVKAIAEGLAAAHKLGIVHRDLKPDNVVVVDGGNPPVKLLDFGIARIVGAPKAEDPNLTATGAIIGTPGEGAARGGSARTSAAREHPRRHAGQEPAAHPRQLRVPDRGVRRRRRRAARCCTRRERAGHQP
ncbi:MAG: serine/threonine-protein kinase [Deltaproteobacteria bacterium]|nr:serine/threonine-protein kinase [Deltaproteobacteria bacterium]